MLQEVRLFRTRFEANNLCRRSHLWQKFNLQFNDSNLKLRFFSNEIEDECLQLSWLCVKAVWAYRFFTNVTRISCFYVSLLNMKLKHFITPEFFNLPPLAQWEKKNNCKELDSNPGHLVWQALAVTARPWLFLATVSFKIKCQYFQKKRMLKEAIKKTLIS